MTASFVPTSQFLEFGLHPLHRLLIYGAGCHWQPLQSVLQISEVMFCGQKLDIEFGV
jgi:hypothetical protein